MLTIFLSHNHMDKPFARQLAERLKAHGIKVWLDEAEMQVGDSLLTKIESAIRNCTYLGVILSPRSVSSPWVQREINMALTEEIHGKRVKVLPLLQEKCSIPGFLMDKVYADFTIDFDSGLSALLQRLNGELHEESYKQERAYEILQSGYQDWISFSKEDNHLLNRSTVDLIIQYVSEVSLSVDLVEFLFASASLTHAVENSSLYLDKLQDWAKPNAPQLFERLLWHSNPRVRIGSLTLFGLFDNNTISDKVLAVVREESHQEVKRVALRTASHLKIPLPESLTFELLESESDWIIQSYALQNLCDRLTCLFVSDGTAFATKIESMIEEVGFHMVILKTSVGLLELTHLKGHLLSIYSFIVIVRGEHFTQYGNEEFYDEIRRFVSEGGVLLATPWVSWENKYHYEFAEILPFCHIRDTYNEDVQVTCTPTDDEFAQQLFSGAISYRASLELLKKRENSTVLLETRDSLPILGFRSFGHGICYYFNTCQHSCFGHMESPLEANYKLAEALRKLLKRIYIQCSHIK